MIEGLLSTGETIVTDTSCDYTVAAGAPGLPENDLVFNSCRPDANLLGTECAVALGDCGGGTMRFAPVDTPAGNAPIQTEFVVYFQAGPMTCVSACSARIPVSMQRI